MLVTVVSGMAKRGITGRQLWNQGQGIRTGQLYLSSRPSW